jgi:hypothetical protein
MKNSKPYQVLTALFLSIIVLSGCAKKEYAPQVKIVNSPSLLALVDESVKDSVLIATPFGPRLRSDIRVIPAGHKLVHAGESLQEVEASTGKLIRDLGVQKPLKYLKSVSSQVRPVKKILSAGPAKPLIGADPINPGWKTWAESTTLATKGPVQYADEINFSADWTVPSLPTNLYNGQTIFLFNALQDASGQTIVQPVLQFGNLTGPYWAILSEYVECGSCIVNITTPVAVSPGDHLTGALHVSHANGVGGTPSYESYFYVNNGSSQVGYIMGQPNATFTTMYTTLEVYDLANSGDYPADSYVEMSGLPSNDFIGRTNTSASLGEHTVVINPTHPATARIYFHPAPPPVPVISYTTPNTLYNGIATSLSPTNTGATATSYSISPALPSGLSINTTTGVISGTPTVTSGATNYTVTATNSSGSGVSVINISVAASATVNRGNYVLGGSISNVAFYNLADQSTTNYNPYVTPGYIKPGNYQVTLYMVGSLYGTYGNGKGYTNAVFADGANGLCFPYTGDNFTFNWTVNAGDDMVVSVYNDNTCPYN